MKYTRETLDNLRAKVRHERISIQHGSPSDVEIAQAQLVDMAGDYIPGLIEEVVRLRGDAEHYNKVLEHAGRTATNYTHAQVADKVRMLTRGDFDHEMVCVLARDRIIVLATQLAASETAAAELLARATKAEQKAGHLQFVAQRAVDTNYDIEVKAHDAITALTERATKAEFERDQWMQEAKAHAARAGYCNGQCGICNGECELKPSLEMVDSMPTELFRVKLTKEEAFGIRNCRASMWHSYAGRICSRAGYTLPGSHTAELAPNDELVITPPPASAPVAPVAGVAAGGLDLTAFRYVAGSEKPALADGEWAFPDNPTNPSGWNVTSQPFPQS